MRIRRTIMLLGLVVLCLAVASEAQTKRRSTKTPAIKKPVVITPGPTPSASPEKPAVERPEPKKNERPAASNGTKTDSIAQLAVEPAYFYQFEQPNFEISKIVIEHDETGKGTITFTKRMFNETETDPLQVSAAAMERINAIYTALNFMDSSENYQYEKDYSHLGTMTFRLERGTRKKTVVFNYTTNKDARALADEYRKLGNQFIWLFDITVARQNQPLESPRLLDTLDNLIRRNEISDPVQMIPLLNELANDERLPLIARNHAAKLVVRIEKGKK